MFVISMSNFMSKVDFTIRLRRKVVIGSDAIASAISVIVFP